MTIFPPCTVFDDDEMELPLSTTLLSLILDLRWDATETYKLILSVCIIPSSNALYSQLTHTSTKRLYLRLLVNH